MVQKDKLESSLPLQVAPPPVLVLAHILMV